MGTLYLVATPIGNLEDITARALRILRNVELIAAEDTRTTRRLLDHFGISTPVTSYFEHSKVSKLDAILDRLTEGDVALVSEAGMPGISDPGYELVRAAVDRGVRVSPIPGPSAVLAALAVAGLPTDQFTYLGFLPRRPAERRRLVETVAAEPRTLVCFEAPHRIEATLEDLLMVLGDRRIAVCRELTKLYEEVYRGTIASAREYFQAPRGEFTIVVEGALKTPSVPLEEALRQIAQQRDAGLPLREAVAAVASTSGQSRRLLYRATLAAEREPRPE